MHYSVQGRFRNKLGPSDWSKIRLIGKFSSDNFLTETFLYRRRDGSRDYERCRKHTIFFRIQAVRCGAQPMGLFFGRTSLLLEPPSPALLHCADPCSKPSLRRVPIGQHSFSPSSQLVRREKRAAKAGGQIRLPGSQLIGATGHKTEKTAVMQKKSSDHDRPGGWRRLCVPTRR